MPWKTDDNGQIEIKDGNPVWTNDDGTEIAVDHGKSQSRITELNAEAKKHRLNAKELREKLEPFVDYDPDEVGKALKTVKNLKDGEFIKADQVDALKEKHIAETRAAYEEKLKARDERINKIINDRLDTELKTGFLSSINSGIIGEKTSLSTAKLVRGQYGEHFRFEEIDGERQIVGYNFEGRKILSTASGREGEPASIEECLAVLYNSDPEQKTISKNLPGGPGSTGGHGQGGKTGEMSAKDFMKGVFSGK